MVTIRGASNTSESGKSVLTSNTMYDKHERTSRPTVNYDFKNMNLIYDFISINNQDWLQDACVQYCTCSVWIDVN